MSMATFARSFAAHLLPSDDSISMKDADSISASLDICWCSFSLMARNWCFTLLIGTGASHFLLEREQCFVTLSNWGISYSVSLIGRRLFLVSHLAHSLLVGLCTLFQSIILQSFVLYFIWFHLINWLFATYLFWFFVSMTFFLFHSLFFYI
jgi:hypothetical protein